MNSDIDLRKPVISSESFTEPAPKSFDFYQTRLRFGSHSDGSVETLQKILKQLARMDLPGKEHAEGYLRHMTRCNRRPRTMDSRWGTILIFLGMLRANGKTRLEEVTRRDVEAFIEHEQDRGIKITTIRLRLTGVQSFLRHLAEEGIVSPDVFGKRIRLQLPERLPRAMDPDDLQKLLSVIEGNRDRAMILVLLRTGMRIGELLNTKVTDVHIKERRIEIYEAQKNRLGRVVYLSEDAHHCVEDLVWGEAYLGGLPFLQSREHGHDVIQHSPVHIRKIYCKSGINSQRVYPAYSSSHLCHGASQCRHAPGVSPGVVGTS